MNNIITNTLSTYEQISIQQSNRNFYLSLAVFIITFISVLIVYLDYRHRKNKERAEKSIEIAKDFALKIVEPLSFIYAFFENFHIDDIINKVNFMQKEDFDIKELTCLYNETDISNYKKILSDNDPNGKIQDMICDILNTLEYQCMYISTKVADEKYIYNSLHQQFLKAISLLYFEIALINTDNKDKYYTNIINVYNLWKNKYIKFIKKERKIKKKQKNLDKKLLLPNPKI